MAELRVLYLLRRPAKELSCPLVEDGNQPSGAVSLVLLERADAPPPGFSGTVYHLEPSGGSTSAPSAGTPISYRELLDLITTHDRTLVL